MLSSLIQKLQNTSRPDTLRYFSRKLALDESALTGMMELLVQKGIVDLGSNRFGESSQNLFER